MTSQALSAYLELGKFRLALLLIGDDLPKRLCPWYLQIAAR